MPARRIPKHPDARLVPPAQPSALHTEAKNAISDAKAKTLSRKLREIISDLETVALATQIGLPCCKGWRYERPVDARSELTGIRLALEDLIAEYPE